MAEALHAALATCTEPVILAVSGGRDSMALLHAAARWARPRIAAVATFDHGTGAQASAAAALVSDLCARLGVPVVQERAQGLARSEAAWRAARWAFLRRVATPYAARVMTAHSWDDQLETIVQRFLRGAGARGLAGLAAPSPVLRPWLSVRRVMIAEWVTREGIPYLDDPTNADVAYQRSRLRHGLLPLMAAHSPGFPEALVALGAAAARWRAEVDAYVDALIERPIPSEERLGAPTRCLRVPALVLERTTDEGRAVLWPAICARVGLTLDAKGTRALVRFTQSSRRGACLEVAGGGSVVRRAAAHHGRAGVELFEVRGASVTGDLPVWTGAAAALPSVWGPWRFRAVAQAPPTEPLTTEPLTTEPLTTEPLTTVGLPAQATVVLRPWAAGDRIQTAGAPAGRRVARYLSEAGVSVVDRSIWPVVMVNDALAWVPGVCRGLAAPSPAVQSDLIWYRCERISD